MKISPSHGHHTQTELAEHIQTFVLLLTRLSARIYAENPEFCIFPQRLRFYRSARTKVYVRRLMIIF